MKILTGKSGITVLFRPAPGSKLVNITYFVRCGAIDEQEDHQDGLCHALEHMFYAGTKNRTWEEISTGFRDLGADSNAHTAFDHTGYTVTVPLENFRDAFELAADVMYNATFPAERWEEIEKKAILSEIMMSWDDPGWALSETVYKHALGPKYHDPVGSAKAIVEASVQDILTFKDRYYRGKNLFLCIAGDLSEREVQKVVDKYDAWSPGRPAKRAKVSFDFNTRKLQKEREGLSQYLVMVTKPLPGHATDREFVASLIGLEILRDYLFVELREKRGLCYFVTPRMFDDLPGHNFLEILTASKPDSGRALTRQVKTSLENFPVEGLTPEKIEQARKAVMRLSLEEESNVTAISMTMGISWLEGRKGDPFEQVQKRVPNVSDRMVKETVCREFSGAFKFGVLKPA